MKNPENFPQSIIPDLRDPSRLRLFSDHLKRTRKELDGTSQRTWREAGDFSCQDVFSVFGEKFWQHCDEVVQRKKGDVVDLKNDD